MEKQKSFWEKVDNVPSVVFLILPLVLVSIPMIHPLGIPITETEYSVRAVGVINKLQAGSVVVIINGGSPTMDGAYGATFVALFKYLWSRHIKTIFMDLRADGLTVPYLKAITSADPDSFKLKYGEDYVVFGYLAGDEVALASFCSDMAHAYPVDLYNTPTKSLPLMQKVNSLKDVQLAFGSIDVTALTDMYVRQIAQAYNIPLIMVLNAGGAPVTAPYYPKQVVGMIVDLQGGAEVERITGFYGLATISTDAQSIGGLLICAIFIASNVIMIGVKFSRRKVKQ